MVDWGMGAFQNCDCSFKGFKQSLTSVGVAIPCFVLWIGTIFTKDKKALFFQRELCLQRAGDGCVNASTSTCPDCLPGYIAKRR